MKATIVIEMDNDAFAGVDCGHELARILHQMARRIDGMNEVECNCRPIKIIDVNGNNVGRLEIEP